MSSPVDRPDTSREAIEQLALAYHKAQDGTGEGEYGCPGVECPGVQRLTAFGLTCVSALQGEVATLKAVAESLHEFQARYQRLTWDTAPGNPHYAGQLMAIVEQARAALGIPPPPVSPSAPHGAQG